MEQQVPQTAQPSNQTVIVNNSANKSVGLALVLTFFFGPLGLLYASVAGGLILFFLGGLFVVVTGGLGALIIWPLSMIWAAIAANGFNLKQRRQMAALQAQYR